MTVDTVKFTDEIALTLLSKESAMEFKLVGKQA